MKVSKDMMMRRGFGVEQKPDLHYELEVMTVIVRSRASKLDDM